MGLSDIAKAPVSHGVEPHDLETGPDLRVPRQPMARSPRSSLLPRERFSPRADSGPSPRMGRRSYNAPTSTAIVPRHKTSGVTSAVSQAASSRLMRGGVVLGSDELAGARSDGVSSRTTRRDLLRAGA